ncbi:MAG: hypothetical protein AB7L09_03115 [Nitrospira sp.]
MSRTLGVEMTILRPHERETLMRGMILRRLRHRTMTVTQVGVGLGEDINEIRAKWGQFDFETYTGLKFEPFLGRMIDDGLVTKEIKTAQRDGEKDEELYGPGTEIPQFDASLSDDMEWFIDDLPMSTRGLFDNMLNDPSRAVTVESGEKLEVDADGNQRVVEDTREILSTPSRHKQDHGLRAGPTGKM